MNDTALPYRVLIVEPDEYRAQRHTLELLRDPDFELVAVCTTKRQATTFLNRHSIDFAIVNVILPDGNGADLIRLVLKRCPDSYVLVTTDSTDDTVVMQSIAAGANGYVLFSDTKATTTNCLRLLLSGGSPVSPVIARSVLRSLHCRVEMRQEFPQNSPLSSRELEVMQLMAKGLSYTHISQILAISEHTVTTHVKKIYRKLNVHSRGEAVYEAQQLNLIH